MSTDSTPVYPSSFEADRRFSFLILDRELQNVSLPAYLAEHHSAAPLDLILDLVGNSHDLFGKVDTYLALDVKYISIGGPPPKGLVGMVRWAGSLAASILLPRILGGVPRTFKFWFMLPSKEGLVRLGEWAANGKSYFLVFKHALNISWPSSLHPSGAFDAIDFCRIQAP